MTACPPAPLLNRALYDAVMVPSYAPAAPIMVRGQGSWLWDQAGRDYVDFSAGIAVCGLGHAHPQLIQALTDQATALWHVGNTFTTEPALRLAHALTQATFAERVFFANSGAEANEAALKLARRAAITRFGAQKTEIIAFNRAFHGRTLFTVTAGGQPSYCANFGPLPADITHLPFNDLPALENALSARTCAVIIEPVQGEGGVRVADDAFLRAARALCDRYQACLIFDEVQCGMGRCGALFRYQQVGVTPDILTAAKALGSGFPLSAMLTRADLAAYLPVGSHGSTYGGNPLACAVGLAALTALDQPALLANVQARSAQWLAGMQAINAQFD
ncbi:MAG: acetylornithine transaminase, partial [Aeromonas sp.]